MLAYWPTRLSGAFLNVDCTYVPASTADRSSIGGTSSLCALSRGGAMAHHHRSDRAGDPGPTPRTTEGRREAASSASRRTAPSQDKRARRRAGRARAHAATACRASISCKVGARSPARVVLGARQGTSPLRVDHPFLTKSRANKLGYKSSPCHLETTQETSDTAAWLLVWLYN